MIEGALRCGSKLPPLSGTNTNGTRLVSDSRLVLPAQAPTLAIITAGHAANVLLQYEGCLPTSKASSMASPITSEVISMRSFWRSNSIMILCSAGRFICLFIMPMACRQHQLHIRQLTGSMLFF